MNIRTFLFALIFVFISCVCNAKWQSMSPYPVDNGIIDVYFINPNTGYILPFNSNMLKTTDGALSWTEVNVSGYRLNKIFFISEAVGWAVGYDCILKTTNGSVSWNLQSNLTLGAFPNIYFISPFVGWVVGEGGIILKTTSGGVNWYRQYSSIIQNELLSIHFLSESLGWIVGDWAILKTSNGGNNWILQSDADHSHLRSVYFISPLKGWAVGNGDMFSTTDGGENWLQNYMGPMESISFSSENIGLITAGNGIFKTIDGGLNWNFQYIGNLYLYKFQFCSSSQGYLVGESDDSNIQRGKIYFTSNICETLIDRSHYIDADFNSVHFENSDRGWTVGMGGKIFITTDGGILWNLQNSGTSNSLNSVFFASSNTGWAVGDQGTIAKTSNAGNNWISQIVHSGNNYRSAHFVSLYTGWVVGNEGTNSPCIIHTTNAGENWIHQIVSQGSGLNSIFMVDHLNGWSVGRSGTILNTINGGENWNNKITGRTENLESVFFISNQIGWAAGENGVLLKTTDGGNTWICHNVEILLPLNMKSVYFTDEQTGWVTGEVIDINLYFGYILKTTDGGENWNIQYRMENSKLNSMFFISENIGWTVGYNGRIIRTTNGGESYFSSDPNPIKLNLKVLMEGMYYPENNWMLRNDSVTVYLRNALPPYSLADSAKVLINNISFSGSLNFINAPSGTYYLVVKHHNCIETWSKTGGEILVNDGSTYSYDFTNSITKAYGNNLKLKGTSYCMFSGDVDNTGTVDLTDVIIIYNDANNFMTGYVISDLTGDGLTDLQDVLIGFNNSTVFVSVMRP